MIKNKDDRTVPCTFSINSIARDYLMDRSSDEEISLTSIITYALKLAYPEMRDMIRETTYNKGSK